MLVCVDTRLGHYIERRSIALVYCRNPACERVKLSGCAPNGIELDLKRFGADMWVSELKAMLACSLCGTRDISLRFEDTRRPFDRGPDAGFASMTQGRAPPPERPAAIEYGWHRKRRQGRAVVAD